jgi:hypothetical protein
MLRDTDLIKRKQMRGDIVTRLYEDFVGRRCRSRR